MARKSGSPSKSENFHKQVAATIEQYRKELLDLTARNPLIAMPFTSRSGSYVRIVDELPDQVFFKLGKFAKMDFVALPAFEDDSKDEQTLQFLEAFSIASKTDEEHARALAKIDPEDEKFDEKVRILERELKDRIREQLGMPKRITRKQESLPQHAKNNGINPSYDLPLPTTTDDDGRHEDDQIQTLLIRTDLERRLNAIISKARTFEQETGISVMRMAFGFLEWKDPSRSDDKTFLSPLVLLPISITVRKSPEGPIHSVTATGDDHEINLVLAEKLRQEFGIELPPFEGGSVEDYFEQLSGFKHKKISWTVRRQIAVGVFPSARMAMYEDLNTAYTDFSESNVVESVIVGSGSAGLGAVPEEYNVDDPEIEAEVPILVKKADQSQFSVLVDLARGKTLAVQGPPGTGKSETIVNAIAAAIGAGKKVLFVAEKAAALKVVNARLAEIGLGEFALPLLAGRTSRDEFMNSIRSRLPIQEREPRTIEAQLDRFSSARDELKEYVQVLSSEWDETGKTVHAVLGSAIASAARIENLSKEILLNSGLPDRHFTDAELAEIEIKADRFEKAYFENRQSPSFWDRTSNLDASPRKLDAILHKADSAKKAFQAKNLARTTLKHFEISDDLDDDDLIGISDVIEQISAKVPFAEIAEKRALFGYGVCTALADFLAQCADCKDAHFRLLNHFEKPEKPDLVDVLNSIQEIVTSEGVQRLDLNYLSTSAAEKERKAASAAEILQRVRRFLAYYPAAADWTLSDMATAKVFASAHKNQLNNRAPMLADSQGRMILSELLRKAENLNIQRSKIRDLFHDTIFKNEKEAADAAATIRNSGKLSILSAKYRDAKAFYQKHSKRKPPELANAHSELETVVNFAAELDAFVENARNSGAFGVKFMGLDTDFSSFDEILKFYESIESHFAHIEQRDIRNFLKSADADLVASLPDGLTEALPGKVSNLESLEGKLQAEHNHLKRLHDRLQPLLNHFKDPASIKGSMVSSIKETLVNFLARKANLEAQGEIADVLGRDYSGWQTNSEKWQQFIEAGTVLDRSGSHGAIVRKVISTGKLAEFKAALAKMKNNLATFDEALAELGEAADCDVTSKIEDLSPAEIEAALSDASNDRQGLVRSISLASLYAGLETDEILNTAERLLENQETPIGLGNILGALVHRENAERVYRHYGTELRYYSGRRLEEMRQQMKDADEKVLELSRKLLRAKLVAEAEPPQGTSRGLVRDKTEMALLEHLVDLRKISIPVRDIIRRSFTAIQEIKPCWMMSPLAIAQYVPRELANFDLCIVDEASQMPPADAIGALYRSDQAMVVGDSKQLPPTNFFHQILDDEMISDDADPETAESILEKTASAFRPSRMLRWHYRSKHSALIRFSNRIMYNDDLVVFPSAEEDRTEMGVSLHQANGLYKSQMNEIEARSVIEAAMQFMKDEPHRSLGIVAVNKKQAEHIKEQIDREISRSTFATNYVEHWRQEREGINEFFVKNLENVQGDERDVIFISTVYGPSASGGKVLQRFGPINGEGGKRRLNVLFTRARQQIKTFTSMSSFDITAEESTNGGAWMLKRWLEYSAGAPIEAIATKNTGQFDSPFEEHVADVVKAMGYEVTSQVGSAGFYIDLGVRHTSWPYGYIMGIECDGAPYHSSKSARDRDHYRQAVLEDLGWHIHRIWSTDWYQDANSEKDRLATAIRSRLEFLKFNPVKKAPVISKNPERDATISDKIPASEPTRTTHRNVLAARKSSPQISLPLEQQAPIAIKPIILTPVKKASSVQCGDTVRIRYLDKGEEFQFQIVAIPSAPEKGLVNASAPLAKALIGADEGDEVEILHGSRIRKAGVIMIRKNR